MTLAATTRRIVEHGIAIAVDLDRFDGFDQTEDERQSTAFFLSTLRGEKPSAPSFGLGGIGDAA